MGELLHSLRDRTPMPPRFAQTYCSQCGAEQGPGNSGVSHCSDHALWMIRPYPTSPAKWPEGLPHLAPLKAFAK
jgi:hypothetical protein